MSGATDCLYVEQAWEGEEVRSDSDVRWNWRSSLTFEEELRVLQLLVPEVGEDLETIFEEALGDSLSNILGQNEAKSLMVMIGGARFEGPSAVFAKLDSILREGAPIVKRTIGREFRTNVHLLLEKVDRNLSADL